MGWTREYIQAVRASRKEKKNGISGKDAYTEEPEN